MTLVGKEICVLANKCIVTGVAGFIGSNLTERLLVEGYEVVGIDCFSDYYPRPMKERNLAQLIGVPGFQLVEADLTLWGSQVGRRVSCQAKLYDFGLPMI